MAYDPHWGPGEDNPNTPDDESDPVVSQEHTGSGELVAVRTKRGKVLKVDRSASEAAKRGGDSSITRAERSMRDISPEERRAYEVYNMKASRKREALKSMTPEERKVYNKLVNEGRPGVAADLFTSSGGLRENRISQLQPKEAPSKEQLPAVEKKSTVSAEASQEKSPSPDQPPSTFTSPKNTFFDFVAPAGAPKAGTPLWAAPGSFQPTEADVAAMESQSNEPDVVEPQTEPKAVELAEKVYEEEGVVGTAVSSIATVVSSSSAGYIASNLEQMTVEAGKLSEKTVGIDVAALPRAVKHKVEDVFGKDIKFKQPEEYVIREKAELIERGPMGWKDTVMYSLGEVHKSVPGMVAEGIAMGEGVGAGLRGIGSVSTKAGALTSGLLIGTGVVGTGVKYHSLAKNPNVTGAELVEEGLRDTAFLIGAAAGAKAVMKSKTSSYEQEIARRTSKYRKGRVRQTLKDVVKRVRGVEEKTPEKLPSYKVNRWGEIEEVKPRGAAPSKKISNPVKAGELPERPLLKGKSPSGQNLIEGDVEKFHYYKSGKKMKRVSVMEKTLKTEEGKPVNINYEVVEEYKPRIKLFIGEEKGQIRAESILKPVETIGRSVGKAPSTVTSIENAVISTTRAAATKLPSIGSVGANLAPAAVGGGAGTVAIGALGVKNLIDTRRNTRRRNTPAVGVLPDVDDTQDMTQGIDQGAKQKTGQRGRQRIEPDITPDTTPDITQQQETTPDIDIPTPTIPVIIGGALLTPKIPGIPNIRTPGGPSPKKPPTRGFSMPGVGAPGMGFDFDYVRVGGRRKTKYNPSILAETFDIEADMPVPEVVTGFGIQPIIRGRKSRRKPRRKRK